MELSLFQKYYCMDYNVCETKKQFNCFSSKQETVTRKSVCELEIPSENIIDDTKAVD